MLADSVANTQPTGAPGVAIDPDTSLAAAPEEYLRALHRGLTLWLVGIAASFTLNVLFGIIFFVLVLSSPKTNPAPLFFGYSVFLLVVCGIGCAAQYLFTIPDPRGVWNQTFENYRRILRVLLWVGAILGLIAMGFAFGALTSQPTTSTGPGSIPSEPFGLGGFARLGVNVFAGVFGLAHTVFLMLYFEQIGMRLHDPWIAARAKMLVWLVPVLMLLFCTVVGPIAAVVLQVQLYWRVRGRVGGLVGTRSDAPL
ncbi:MAG: hypothetical protein JNM86_09980 [Phycisphaerae bacterium]|nr:hypothetical protein [Phycisphaerae bacterium]